MNVHVMTDPASFSRQSKLVMDFAAAALNAGDVAEAERLLRDRLARAPNDSEAMAQLARIAASQLRIDEATILLRRAASVDPSLARQLDLLRHLQSHAGADAVLAALDTMPVAVRDSFPVRCIEAVALNVVGAHDREVAVYQDLTARVPGDPVLWTGLGEALKTVGRLDEAVAALRNAMRCGPSYGQAYWTLANFKHARFEDGEIAAMRRALKKKLGPRDAMFFHFALGEAMEARGLYQQSFRHYAAANALRARDLTPDQMYVTPVVDSAIPDLTAEFFDRRSGAGCADGGAIFVVGLHRSGSTLIEQILASHPMIEGLGETPIMSNLWSRFLRSAASNGRGPVAEIAAADPAAIRSVGEEYMARTRAYRRTERPYFVDKLPTNWLHLGLIRVALPNARIIDARRHPLACGFSNFKQHFDGNAFSFSLESVGAFYRDYWRFMRHFDAVQPSAAHRVINERLIADPEREIRAMLDFVGVPFDPLCLEFHGNKRAVRTPSAEQVRRPLNRDGVDYWRNYEPWLGPLKAALGPALDHWQD